MPNHLCSELLPGHQSHRFTCINEGNVVVLGGDRFCKLLMGFAVLRECLDVGVPSISKAIAQGTTWILRRPGQSLRDIEGPRENGVGLLGSYDPCAGLLGVLTLWRGQQSGSDPDPFGTSTQ